MNQGAITGASGVYLTGSAGTLTNSGTITATAALGAFGVYVGDGATIINSGRIISPAADFSIQFKNSGFLSNSSSGYIGSGGIDFGGTSGAVTLVNAGTIVDNSGPGIVLYGNGGTVTNSGTITASSFGVYGGNLAASGTIVVSNSGRISGDTDGVFINNAAVRGAVTNTGTIIGTTGVGVYLLGGGTIIDSGTITGGVNAVQFGGTGSNLLVLENGYKLVGTVAGSGAVGAIDTLELSGALGAVTVNYNGLNLSSFEDILFGSSGTETLKISNNTAGSFTPTISGFITNSQTIDLTGIGTNGAITGTAGNVLTIAGSLGTVTLKLDVSDGTTFTLASDGGTGTDLIACFSRGTLILTSEGEVAVEDLAIGDRVVTFSGKSQPIKWIGRRVYDGRFLTDNRAVLPIRVEAGALANGVPARDLWVSPEHSLYIDGVLVQAKHLINGATIVQAESVERVEYWHIELAAHDVILADGAPAETFVDCDNRFMFHNAAEYALLYPDDDRPTWEFCARRLEWGSDELATIRAGLLARAETLGRITADADLHLIADGQIVRAQSVANRVWRFALRGGARSLAIASRSVVPHASEAASADERALGVAIERIILVGAGLRIEIGHDCPALGAGFHADEGGHRWTDGLAHLPEELLRPLAGDSTVEIQLAEMVLRYRCEAPAAAAAPAPPKAAPARAIAPRRAARAARRETRLPAESLSL